MPEATTTVRTYTCQYCGYTWIPRVPQPKACTKCKRYDP